MKRKLRLLLIIVLLLVGTTLALTKFMFNGNKTSWWNHLEYSPPLLIVPELASVIMQYNDTTLGYFGYFVNMKITNNSEYGIQRNNSGCLYHDSSTIRLEFFDGENWRIMVPIYIPPPPPSFLAPPIHAGEIYDTGFLLERRFGVLNPGLYRFVVTYYIHASISIFETLTNEELEQRRLLSQQRGPHNLVAEFHV